MAKRRIEASEHQLKLTFDICDQPLAEGKPKTAVASKVRSRLALAVKRPKADLDTAFRDTKNVIDANVIDITDKRRAFDGAVSRSNTAIVYSFFGALALVMGKIGFGVPEIGAFGVKFGSNGNARLFTGLVGIMTAFIFLYAAVERYQAWALNRAYRLSAEPLLDFGGKMHHWILAILRSGIYSLVAVFVVYCLFLAADDILLLVRFLYNYPSLPIDGWGIELRRAKAI
jgi:hypothetical protein